jgi:DHA1 family tetracycline resistance protein-like MFS transporter
MEVTKRPRRIARRKGKSETNLDHLTHLRSSLDSAHVADTEPVPLIHAGLPMKKPTLLVIFLTVFIDLIGFGIVLPMLPIYSKEFGASGFVLGIIIASFSAMQFLFAPAWGRLSDRIGRRPVLLVSTACAAVSYSAFAVGSGVENHTIALLVLLISRVFAGLCGANITVAQAYIADITPPTDRSRRMGLIGMAFGLGFICGPVLGAVSVKWFGITGPGWVAAVLCAANFVLALFILPESWRPTSEHVAQRPHWEQCRHTLAQPGIGLLVGVFFLATFCFTCYETTLGLLIMRNFGLNVEHDDRAKMTVGYLFAYSGIIGAFVQGGMIGRLVRKFGEANIIALSLMFTAASLFPMPMVKAAEPLTLKVLGQAGGLPWLELLGLLALLAIGSGLTRPPLFGLISRLTSAQEQGVTIGVTQSAGSLARILGPLFTATLFDSNPRLPYMICAGVSLVAGVITWQSLCRRKLPQPAPETPGAK